MLFQVVNREGLGVMRTEDAECIPDEQSLMSMQKAGYKFKLDGKAVSIKKIKEIRKV